MRKWLELLRIKRKMTKQAVADYLGISQNYYHYIEIGERQKDLDLSIVVKLSELFGVTVEWIAEQERMKSKNGKCD